MPDKEDVICGCGFIGIVSLIGVLVAGWIGNVVQVIVFLMDAGWDDMTPFIILKIVGIFLAPLGSVLGIIGWF